ncbi:hypothetical protein [Maribacter aquivivus]|uniref:hypothetical protein n=1 Tax=Maribacter aquivivus TaxID=228958 RepID=UPI00249161AA|nr:hypothetical protein [Maribacter aquivivus]
MKKDLIKVEINGLKDIRLDWSRTRMSKSKAQELFSKIGIFEHTFSVNYPNTKKYYQTDSFVRLKFMDGKDDIEYYANSNLKKKDDEYFRNGLKNLDQAIKGLIQGLDEKTNSTE